MRGEELLTSYRSSPDTVKTFCRICGSPMVNSWDPEPENYGLAMGSLEDDPVVRSACHIFVGWKAPWCEITDNLPQYQSFPGSELVDEYHGTSYRDGGARDGSTPKTAANDPALGL